MIPLYVAQAVVAAAAPAAEVRQIDESSKKPRLVSRDESKKRKRYSPPKHVAPISGFSATEGGILVPSGLEAHVQGNGPRVDYQGSPREHNGSPKTARSRHNDAYNAVQNSNHTHTFTRGDKAFDDYSGVLDLKNLQKVQRFQILDGERIISYNRNKRVVEDRYLTRKEARGLNGLDKLADDGSTVEGSSPTDLADVGSTVEGSSPIYRPTTPIVRVHDTPYHSTTVPRALTASLGHNTDPILYKDKNEVSFFAGPLWDEIIRTRAGTSIRDSETGKGVSFGTQLIYRDKDTNDNKILLAVNISGTSLVGGELKLGGTQVGSYDLESHNYSVLWQHNPGSFLYSLGVGHVAESRTRDEGPIETSDSMMGIEALIAAGIMANNFKGSLTWNPTLDLENNGDSRHVFRLDAGYYDEGTLSSPESGEILGVVIYEMVNESNRHIGVPEHSNTLLGVEGYVKLGDWELYGLGALDLSQYGVGFGRLNLGATLELYDSGLIGIEYDLRTNSIDGINGDTTREHTTQRLKVNYTILF